jgi:hypothetical protein
MGRCHLERGDGNDGDGLEHAVLEVLGDVGGNDGDSGEVSAGKINPKADEDLNMEPGPTKTKRVPTEKMKAALQRATKAKAEKREKVKQSKASSYAPQFFFDVV